VLRHGVLMFEWSSLIVAEIRNKLDVRKFASQFALYDGIGIPLQQTIPYVTATHYYHVHCVTGKLISDVSLCSYCRGYCSVAQMDD
jgi:hypothetical protein